MDWRNGGGRSMQEQGPHEEHVATGNRTGNNRRLRLCGLDLLHRQSSATVRAWDHADRAVVLTAVVKMNANSQHAFQNRDGRLHMNHTFFNRPRPETGDIESGFDGNRQVLMPGHLPICGRGLIEEDGAGGERIAAKHALHQGADGIQFSQIANAGDAIQEVANPPFRRLRHSQLRLRQSKPRPGLGKKRKG